MLVDGKLSCKKIENLLSGFTKLDDWLKSKQIIAIHACMEATGIYGYKLATFLHNENNVVSIINLAQIKGFAQSILSRNKTDKADAKLIVHFCQAMNPPALAARAPGNTRFTSHD